MALLLALALPGCTRGPAKASQLEAQADILAAAGNNVGAAQLLMKAMRYDSNDPGRWVKLGRARRDIGQPGLAVEAFQQAFDLDPTNVEAMQNLAVLYVAGHRYDAAKRIVDPLLTLNPEDPAGLLASGAIAYYEERYDEAIRIADHLSALTPNSREGPLLKAHVLEKTGKAAEGARLLEDELKRLPDDPQLATQLLELYQSIGSVEGVRRTALILARVKPDDPRYQLESLRAYQAQGDTESRERVSAALVQRYPNNPQVLGALADFWAKALPRDDAARRIEAAANVAGTVTKATLVGRLTALGAFAAAERVLGPVASQPVTTATIDLHAQYAALLLAEGKVDAARQAAQTALDFDSANEVALLTRARAAMAQRQYDKALADAQLIVSNDPGADAASLLIAQAYAAKGDDALAAAAFGDAQSRSPNNVALARARANWLISKGRAAEAAQIAGLFARTTNRDEAWALYADTCRAAKDPLCLAQAVQRSS